MTSNETEIIPKSKVLRVFFDETRLVSVPTKPLIRECIS